jgi:predicted O-methyltransferase YrrM
MKTIDELIKEYLESYESRGMWQDAKILHDYVVERKLTNILEFGILHGSTTRALAIAASKIEDSNYVSVDIEQGCIDEASAKLTDDDTRRYVNFVCSDSIKFLQAQPYNKWDLIFIDTDHTLRQTIAELFLAASRIKTQDGYIFMHDAHMDGVRQAADLFRFYNAEKFEMNYYQTDSGMLMFKSIGEKA